MPSSEIEALERRMRSYGEREGIDPDMVETLVIYVTDGCKPGSFTTAVLENDLKEACARADNTNRHRIFEIVGFIYNHLPSLCWGSPERVTTWLAKGGLNGIVTARDRHRKEHPDGEEEG